MSAEQKALHACADYARLHVEIKRLTLALGDALDHCPGVAGKRLPADWVTCSGDDAQAHHDDITHLKEAYTPETVDGEYEPHLVWMNDFEIREYLAVCPHCLAAHEAIQARKAARKALGKAKRAITMIGRAASKAAA
jgi:hypothetical protein